MLAYLLGGKGGFLDFGILIASGSPKNSLNATHYVIVSGRII